MTFAEEMTYKYIRRHHSRFCCVDVLEILSFLPCLTASDQDRLRASYKSLGNRDTLWELFNHLQRRMGWVEHFVQALRLCELTGLADQVDSVYRSYLPPGSSPSSLPSREVLGAPALAPAPSALSAPHNGYPEEPSFPTPVQDTQRPESPGQSSVQASQTPSSRGPRDPASSGLPALSPLTSGDPPEQDPKLSGTHIAGTISSPLSPSPSPSPRGPVSPTVSFQPLPRPTSRTGRPPSSPSSPGLAAVEGAGDQSKPVWSSDVPARPTTAGPAPAEAARVGTVPSKLPVSSKSTGTAPPNVPTHPVPSRLPANPTRLGTTPSKLPARGSSRAQETGEARAPSAAVGGGAPPQHSGPGSTHSLPEPSKPGVLRSTLDGQPCSICSDDLAISSSLGPEPSHGPEENEYSSFALQVAGDPSGALLRGAPRPEPPPGEQEVPCAHSRAWAGWLGAAALLAALLAALYRRRLQP